MKYKLSKKAPTPGEIKNAEIEEVSLVDVPANGVKLLLKKGMSMDEELRKKLLAEGINPENLSKSSKADLAKIGTAMDAITVVTDEPTKKGLIATVKGFLGITEPVTKSDNGSNSELSDRLEKIEKSIESLVKSSQSAPEPASDTPAPSELEELKKKSSDIAKAIEEENNKDSEIEELRKKVSEQEKQLEQIKKRRTGGNAHAEPTTKTEPVNKSVFAGSPFDIG